ncbi:hypothetical protein Tco_0260280 [Tanacetum coccineum]
MSQIPNDGFPEEQSTTELNELQFLMIEATIPCSPECKIVGQILLDHPLSYALTTTADVPVVYLQQFWQTVHKTPDNPFVAPVTIEIIESFMNKVGYQGVVDKVSTFYMKNLAQPWQTMFKVFNRCLTIRASRHDQTKINIIQLFHVVINRTNVDYAALLWGKKRKQNIRESSSSSKTQKITIRKKKQSSTPIPPPRDDRPRERERDEVAEATILSLTLHKTALAAEAQENIAKVQEKLDEEDIEKMVEGEEDEESHASEFANSMINDDVDDSGTKIEHGSNKEQHELFNDDDDQIEKEKHDEGIKKDKKDEKIEKENKHDDDEKIDKVVMEKDDGDDVEKVDKGVKEKSNVDFATGSMEFRKEKMQTPIPSPIRSPRNVSSSDKTVTKELTGNVSPTPATTSKDLQHGQIRSHIKNKFITHDFFMGKIREVLDHCNKVVLELTFAKTNEMINKEMPRLVNLAVNKDREVDPINAQEMISKEFSTHALKMIEELF